MAVSARKIRSAAPEPQSDVGADDASLDPREVLITLETSGYLDDDIDAARGLVNAAIVSVVFWSLTIGGWLILS